MGVMSIWFFCTVCKKVRRGRTTCRPGPGSGWNRHGRHQAMAGTCSPCWLDRVGKGSCSGGTAVLHLPVALHLVHSLPACNYVSSCPGQTVTCHKVKSRIHLIALLHPIKITPANTSGLKPQISRPEETADQPFAAHSGKGRWPMKGHRAKNAGDMIIPKTASTASSCSLF